MVAIFSAVARGLFSVDTKPQVTMRIVSVCRPEPHRHQGGIVRGFEALDLQVMLRMPEAEVTAFLSEAGVVAELVDHAPVEHRLRPAMPASSSLRRPDRAIDEQPNFIAGCLFRRR